MIMNSDGVQKPQKIIIVGAGIFGLSTALSLTKRGYEDIHIFDKQPYHENGYSVSAGCDAASADENKILRASYGGRKLYQDLAFEAMKHWESWNERIKTAKDLPPNLSNSDKLWEKCGFLRIGDSLTDEEVDTQANFPDDIKHTQYRISKLERRKAAVRDGISLEKLDPFARRYRCLKTEGILDMTAGFVLASKACSFALHLCQDAGVNIHLGPNIGQLSSLVKNGKAVKGIKTADGQCHLADLVIIAAGGWTPSLVPEADRILETTAGSIVMIRIPEDRHDLWDKYDPLNFPVWSWNMTKYDRQSGSGGLYGLPRTRDGIVKFGFRGAKWTNYSWETTESGRAVSYPNTDLDQVPEKAMHAIRLFCQENMPELLDLPVEKCRLCWYTDSVDNSFLIDRVPDIPSLMIASGGSGHGFKFLPVLGDHVVDVIEERETDYTRLFRWRSVPDGLANGLQEGVSGWRTLDKQVLAGRETWGTGV